MFLSRIFSKREKRGKVRHKKKSLKKLKPQKRTIKRISPTLQLDNQLQKRIFKEEVRLAKKIAFEFSKEYEKTLKEEDSSKKINKKGYDFFKTGIPGFDVLLKSGGVPLSTSTLIEGGPGSGKTIFCLHVAMDFCKRGKTVLYMTFEEPADRLVEHMEMFGFEPRKYIKSGNLIIRRFNALDIARSVEALLSEAKKELLIEVQPILIPQDIKPDLVLVDSLTSISSAFSGEESRFRIYMEQLFRYLEEHKMSSLLIREVSNPTHTGAYARIGDEATSFLSDGIICFYNVIFADGHRTRAVEILKLRGQEFYRGVVEAEIKNGKGLIIYPNKPIQGKYTLT